MPPWAIRVGEGNGNQGNSQFFCNSSKEIHPCMQYLHSVFPSYLTMHCVRIVDLPLSLPQRLHPGVPPKMAKISADFTAL